LLRKAGLSGRLDAGAVARARAGGLMIGVALAAALVVPAPPAALLGLVVGVAGHLAPDRWLARRVARRRAEIERELPDLLDLIGVCVSAGMPLDAALRTAAGRTSGPLADEVRFMLRSLDLGTPRRRAYRELADATGSEALARTVAALRQADELGSPIAGAVAAQAGEMRAARDASARESAARAAPKIQLVVALMMVPAVMIVVMAVLVTELARQVGVVVGGA
jgi:tight adherence protein C